MPQPPLVLELTRGPIVECRHLIHLAVWERGKLRIARGDMKSPMYFRSSAKPFQAAAVVASGAADAFGLAAEDLALAAASHSGETRHVERARAMLKRGGLGPEALRCGAMAPSGDLGRQEMAARGEPPGPLHNNCSGKHAAMLLEALHRKAPTETYLEPSHPVQAANAAAVSAATGVPVERLVIGTDGCGAPNFAVPLPAMARAYARAALPVDLEPDLARALARVVSAMTEHPEMVGGDGVVCTEVMRSARGRLVGKRGAEGLFCCAVVGRDTGMALRLESGDDRWAPFAAVRVLKWLGWLDGKSDTPGLAGLAQASRTNVAGREVGTARVRVSPGGRRFLP